MGSSRDAGDERRIEDLKRLAEELDIKANVSFIVNAPFHDIQQILAGASIGLSTMVDEHFGINVVEFMVGADNVRRVCNRADMFFPP
jgi:alpha-1,2-mannosyltransferase